MPRLSILTNDEVNALYSIPKLDDEERSHLFALDDEDQTNLEALKTVPRKINYILQRGYYQATNYFFRFSFQNYKSDVQFILETYFPDEPFPKKQISKNYHYLNRTLLMQKYQLTDTDSQFEKTLLKQARSFAKRHVLPKFVLQELLSFCLQQKVIRPAYSKLQLIVSEALNDERDRLINKLYRDASKYMRNQLDKLLDNEDLFYNLTLLKKDQKDFSTKEILKSVAKQAMIHEIYQKSLKLIPNLGISEQNIIYYANLAEFYTIQKLKQLNNKNHARLLMLCYVHHRLLKINDHLATSFIQKVCKYTEHGNDYQKSKVDVVEAVDKELRNQACKVLAININKSIKDERIREKAFHIIPETDYKKFLTDFKKPNYNRDFYRWEYYKKISMTIKRNIRPLFKTLDFVSESDEMNDAANFLKRHLENKKSFSNYDYDEIPLGFFPKTTRRFLTYKIKNNDNKTVKKIDGDCYEFMVYLQLKKAFSDGTVFIKDSISYRALEDELIDIKEWSKNKKKIIKQLNLPLLSMDITDMLEHLKKNLENKYTKVNERIQSGDNSSIKIKYNKKGEPTKWTLPYTASEDGVNNSFFEQLPVMSIGDIIRFADDATGFLKNFSHIQPKYSKLMPSPEVVNACIVANATGIETKKMKEISDVNDQDLDSTNKNYILYSNLCSSSNTIMEHTSKLGIFDEYNLSDYGVHASVDGQKFATKYNTIKSRHSKKYLGLMKGVVLFSLNANHLPLCLKVIGANEHESHFLLDIVESNESDLEIKAVSGDMHSINRVNFALMHLFGYRFMPRITRFGDKSDSKLVSFDAISNYSGNIIKPSKKINQSLIIKEWDNVLRILASLALKKTTQSQIVRKLSSYKKTNPTLNALIAFDEMIMTDYMLEYIDSPEVRSVVQKSLCRGESYHQLSSTIAKVSGGRMINGRNEIELDVNAESIRLIANAVILYNATILSSLYDHFQKIDPEKAKEITRLSPVAWQHISFIGKYEFYNRGKPINIQEVIEKLLANSEIDFSAVSQ
ncbi:MAG: Tn3 family transposase [Methylococcales bacterium]|jgi:TnpA family transposase|nr:Tn3 family transposase [Methylococcales bacterium]MBT7409404.1 Tn3 family transposase [Methylococcales bacterium]